MPKKKSNKKRNQAPKEAAQESREKPATNNFTVVFAVLTSLVWAFVLGNVIGMEFSSIQRKQLVRRGVLLNKESELVQSIDYSTMSSNEVLELVNETKALREEIKSIKPFIFEKWYFSSVFYQFGLHVGTAVAAIWTIGLCLIGFFKKRIEEPLLVLLCMLAGAMIWQLPPAYQTLVAGNARDVLYASFRGSILGLVVGAVIGIILALILKMRNQKQPIVEEQA